jgi:hypothetical protein
MANIARSTLPRVAWGKVERSIRDRIVCLGASLPAARPKMSPHIDWLRRKSRHTKVITPCSPRHEVCTVKDVSMSYERPMSPARPLEIDQRVVPLTSLPSMTQDEQPDRGRFGTEETPHGCARDSRACGESVAPINPVDGTCNLTEIRARRVPSPRAVRDPFPELYPTGAQPRGGVHRIDRYGF